MPSPVRGRPAPVTLRRAAWTLDTAGPHHESVARLLHAIADGRLNVSTDEAVMPRDILGNAGVRRVCGKITRATLIRWRNGVGVAVPFPEPIRKVNGTELWDRVAVKRWLEENRSKEER